MEKKYNTISISDQKYFRLKIGKRVLIKDLHNKKQHPTFGNMGLTKGDGNTITLYSSNPSEIYGYVEKSNITTDFSNPYILWGIDGDFTFNIKQKGVPFATTDHCGAIEVIHKNIFPEYLVLQLEIQKSILGFDRTLRPSLELMEKKIIFEIPFTSDQEPDLAIQKHLVDKYKPVLNFKMKINEIEAEIMNQNITYDPNYEYVEVPLSEVFEPKQGNMFYTKKRILENKWEGDIPVYSSNTEDDGILIKIKENEILPQDLYHQNCLTWSIDGSYVGKMFIRNQDNISNEKKKQYFFTANNHCGILLPKKNNLYLPFFKHLLEPLFMSIGKGNGRQKLGSNQINDISIKIPIDKNKNFDFEKQKEIAKVFTTIENTKNELLTQLQTMKDQQVSVTQ